MFRHWGKSIRYLRGALGQTLLPRCCGGCGKELGINETDLCELCWRGLQEAVGKGTYCKRCGAEVGEFTESEGGCNYCRNFKLRYEGLARVGVYKGPLAEMIRRLKFNRQAYAANFLAELLWQAVQGAGLEQFDMITCVPLHWRRRWSRGYNQSHLLGSRLASMSGRPFRPLLRRTRWTDPQTHLSRQARLDNVRGVFALRRSISLAADLSGKRILLIDDVLTTGATASEAAGVLAKAGAKIYVGVVAVAANR